MTLKLYWANNVKFLYNFSGIFVVWEGVRNMQNGVSGGRTFVLIIHLFLKTRFPGPSWLAYNLSGAIQILMKSCNCVFLSLYWNHFCLKGVNGWIHENAFMFFFTIYICRPNSFLLLYRTVSLIEIWSYLWLPWLAYLRKK